MGAKSTRFRLYPQFPDRTFVPFRRGGFHLKAHHHHYHYHHHHHSPHQILLPSLPQPADLRYIGNCTPTQQPRIRATACPAAISSLPSSGALVSIINLNGGRADARAPLKRPLSRLVDSTSHRRISTTAGGEEEEDQFYRRDLNRSTPTAVPTVLVSRARVSAASSHHRAVLSIAISPLYSFRCEDRPHANAIEIGTISPATPGTQSAARERC